MGRPHVLVARPRRPWPTSGVPASGPSQLEETGPQVERIWESVIVQYQDVDGSTKTVGPVGSGADTETDDLKDDDPDNPANKLGITRRDLLVMGIGTAASATEVGRRFLEESKLLDSSGRARLIGHVQDSHGVWHPYSHVRAGDTISFVDSSDTSYQADRPDRQDPRRPTCSVDLDAPPEGLQALLERLGVVLVPLGVLDVRPLPRSPRRPRRSRRSGARIAVGHDRLLRQGAASSSGYSLAGDQASSKERCRCARLRRPV